jgi:hypothetical protein
MADSGGDERETPGWGKCYSIAALEADADGQVSGRWNVTLGARVGGQGRMNIRRDRAGTILCVADHVLNHRGPDGFGRC